MSQWVAVQDPNSGRTYYANMATGQSQWDPPPGFTGSTEPQVLYQAQSEMDLESESSYGQSESNLYAEPNQERNDYPSQSSLYASQQKFNANAGSSSRSMVNSGGGGGGTNSKGKAPPPVRNNNNNTSASTTNFKSGANANTNKTSASTTNFTNNKPSTTNFNNNKPSTTNFNNNTNKTSASTTNFSTANKMGTNLITSSSTTGPKWRKAKDPNTGKDYYYHIETKETRWTMPPELIGQVEEAPQRVSAVNMMQGFESSANFKAAWDDESDEEEENENEDSWNKDEKEESGGDQSSDDNLAEFDKKQDKDKAGPSNVIDEPSSSDSEKKVEPFNPAGVNEEEDVLVDDDANKYWMIGESQADKYRMVDYGEKYFQKDKHKKSLFTKKTVSEILQWEPYSKMDALKKLDSKLNQQAKQTWKNINSYTRDRKSSKKVDGHVDKLLRFALKAPEELRDEIFCQLVKVTTKNPKAESLQQAWKLMCICTSIFPPSDEFANYLAVYLYQQSKEAGNVGEAATFALKALDRTMEATQRRIQPMPDEIKRIEVRGSISIKVQFLDGSHRTLLVTSQTRASQIQKTIADTYRMRHPESFGLFESEQPRPGWEKEVYQRREKMETEQKIDDLQNLPMDRELEMSERIMDVVASWKRSKKKKDRKISFVYKCKLFSKAQETSYSRQEWKVCFVTAAWHVLHGLYPVSEDHAFQLAALQLQATHGLKDDNFYIQGVINAEVENYIPYAYLRKYRPDEAETKVLSLHAAHKHLDKPDAYRKYIELLRKDASPQYFGNCFFHAVKVSRLKKKKEEQDDVVLGISENGVIFVDPYNNKIAEKYKMEEILTYGFRSNAFLFVAGTLMTQKKYQFATMLGKQINDLLRAHIDLRVQQAEIQGYQINTQV